MRVIVKPLGAAVAAATLLGSGMLVGRTFNGPARTPRAPAKAVVETPPLSPRGAVYTNGFANSWDLGGSARVTDTEEKDAYGGTGMAMRVEAGAGGTVKFLRERPLDLSPYDRLAFRINGGEKGGQRLVVQTTPTLKRRQTIRLGAIPKRQWASVVIPLDELSSHHALDTFSLKNAKDEKAPPFYIDDVRFLAPGEDLPAASPSPDAAPRQG